MQYWRCAACDVTHIDIRTRSHENALLPQVNPAEVLFHSVQRRVGKFLFPKHATARSDIRNPPASRARIKTNAQA